MKPNIHPSYREIEVKCGCGNQFTVNSTGNVQTHVDVCYACHPFYTGKKKTLDSGGRIDRFNKKYGGHAKPSIEKAEKKK